MDCAHVLSLSKPEQAISHGAMATVPCSYTHTLFCARVLSLSKPEEAISHGAMGDCALFIHPPWIVPCSYTLRELFSARVLSLSKREQRKPISHGARDWCPSWLCGFRSHSRSASDDNAVSVSSQTNTRAKGEGDGRVSALSL